MSHTDPTPVVKFLDWDSQFFTQRIGRVISPVLTNALMAEINAFAVQNKLDCLYFLADSAQRDTILLAEQDAYRLVDIRMTFKRKLGLPPQPIDGPIRLVKESDLPYLKQIAASAYTDTRFYADSHFNRSQCSQMYEIWVQKDCQNPDGCVWIYEENQVPVGFVTCLLYTSPSPRD